MPGISLGAEVEVRTRYLASWTSGFVITSVDGDRVGVRRRSDGVELPVTVPIDDFRPAARESSR